MRYVVIFGLHTTTRDTFENLYRAAATTAAAAEVVATNYNNNPAEILRIRKHCRRVGGDVVKDAIKILQAPQCAPRISRVVVCVWGSRSRSLSGATTNSAVTFPLAAQSTFWQI